VRIAGGRPYALGHAAAPAVEIIVRMAACCRHHALTLQCWLQRFEHSARRIRETIGETKYRIWRVYLAGRAYALAAGTASLYPIVGQKAGSAATGANWTGAVVAAENCALSTDAALYPCGTAGSPYSEHAPKARAPMWDRRANAQRTENPRE